MLCRKEMFGPIPTNKMRVVGPLPRGEVLTPGSQLRLSLPCLVHSGSCSPQVTTGVGLPQWRFHRKYMSLLGYDERDESFHPRSGITPD